MDREQIVATKSAIQTIGHGIKIPAFLSIGFPYAEHMELIVPLVACAAGGTIIGTRVLKRVDERFFQLAFRLFLAGLGLRLLAGGICG